MAVDIDFSDKEFEDFVFAGYAQLLAPNEVVQQLIAAIPYRKFVFANDIRAHCLKVLQLLGLSGAFDAVLSCDDVDEQKPRAGAFLMSAEAAGVHPSNCWFVDDSISNLRGAKAVGMSTVWVIGREQQLTKDDDADVSLHCIEELLCSLPQLGKLPTMDNNTHE